MKGSRLRVGRRWWGLVAAGTCMLVAGLTLVVAADGTGGARWLAVNGLAIVLLTLLLVVRVLLPGAPQRWDPTSSLTLRARATYEVTLRGGLVLVVALAGTAGWAAWEQAQDPGVHASRRGLGVLVLAPLVAVPTFVRMVAGRLPWVRLELGPRLVYRGWYRRLDLEWRRVKDVRADPRRPHEVLLRYGGDEVRLPAYLFPGAPGQLAEEIRRRAQDARRGR